MKETFEQAFEKWVKTMPDKRDYEPKLADWIKPGAMVYANINGVERLLKIQAVNGDEATLENIRVPEFVINYPVKYLAPAKLVPWTEKNAPLSFKDSEGNTWEKHYSLQWGYLCGKVFHNFASLASNVKRHNGRDCGTWERAKI